MLEITGTPVRASSGAISSSVRKPPQETSSESADGAEACTRALKSMRSCCVTLSMSVMASMPMPLIATGSSSCSSRKARSRAFTSSL